MRLLVDTKYDIVSQACFRQQVTRSISNHTLILMIYIKGVGFRDKLNPDRSTYPRTVRTSTSISCLPCRSMDLIFRQTIILRYRAFHLTVDLLRAHGDLLDIYEYAILLVSSTRATTFFIKLMPDCGSIDHAGSSSINNLAEGTARNLINTLAR